MTRPAAIIIPALNEEAHIGGLLAQLGRHAPAQVRRIIVADGGSSDATRAIVERFAREDGRVELRHNPARLQSAGINAAVSTLEPDIAAFVRIDAHSAYPDDYASHVLERLETTGAQVIATRLLTVGRTAVQRAIAAASNSLAGTGGSAHRQGGWSGFVDHGHHAGFDRAMFDRVGGYDESFPTNEDAEFDTRVRRAGGRIWLASEIEVLYYPRASIGKLARQYWRYGDGRARTVLKHRQRPRLRQLIPFLFCVGLVISLLTAFFWPLALLYPLLYVVAIGAATINLVIRTRSAGNGLALPALAAMHLGWGFGFMVRLAGAAVGMGRGVQRT